MRCGWLVCAALACGCAPSSPIPPEPDEAQSTQTAGDEATDATDSSTAQAPPPEPSSALPEAPPALAEHVDAGTIERGVLLATLQEGIGRFLQQVQTRATFERGRFVGWRVVAFHETEPRLGAGVVRVGDMVMRINGHSIERPEQFKNVWDAMRTSGELVLEIRRDGRDSRVRYLVVETPPLETSAPPPVPSS